MGRAAVLCSSIPIITGIVIPIEAAAFRWRRGIAPAIAAVAKTIHAPKYTQNAVIRNCSMATPKP
jgi:hypothetical protein